MRYLYIVAAILMFSCWEMSCALKHGLETRKIFLTETSNRKPYKIEIPVGYQKYLAIEGHGTEYQFWYPDSSVVYFSTEKAASTIVAKNIDFSNEERNKRLNAFFTYDTLTQEGVKDSLYWKEVILQNIVVGYYKVSRDKKDLFDHSVQKNVAIFSK